MEDLNLNNNQKLVGLVGLVGLLPTSSPHGKLSGYCPDNPTNPTNELV